MGLGAPASVGRRVKYVKRVEDAKRKIRVILLSKMNPDILWII